MTSAYRLVAATGVEAQGTTARRRVSSSPATSKPQSLRTRSSKHPIAATKRHRSDANTTPGAHGPPVTTTGKASAGWLTQTDRRTMALHRQIRDALPAIPVAQPLKVGDEQSPVAKNRDIGGWQC